MTPEKRARETVEQLNAAIVSGDYARIISLLVPQAHDMLIAIARSMGVEVSTIEEAVERIYGGMDDLWAGVRIDAVEVEDDLATVTYSHTTYGRDPDDVILVRYVDGRWLIDFTQDDYDHPVSGAPSCVGLVHGDVQAGAAHRLLGGRQASGVAELGEDRGRDERPDAVVAHQRSAAGLTASDPLKLEIERV